jgi:two-component system cell cycle sensor histidine kinase/response regulator CckA
MNEDLKILILEDSPKDADLILNVLRNSDLKFSTVLVSDKETYIKQLELFLPDLILAEYSLPSFETTDALTIAGEFCPDSPFIIFSGKINEEIAISLLKMGITDYVYKSHPDKLAYVIKRACSEIKEKSQRKLAECFLSVQNSLTRILTEANSMAEANPKLLQFICEVMGWEVGQIWNINHSSESIYCESSWSDSLLKIENFKTVTQDIFFSRGENILGMAWETQKPVWLKNIREFRDDCPLIRAATRNGLKSLLVFPVLNNNKVITLLSFYSVENKQFDNEINKMFISLCQQIGNFIENKSIAEKIREQATLLDIVQDAIIVCSLDYSIIFWNKGAENLYGWTAEEVLNKKAFQFVFKNKAFKFSEARELLNKNGDWQGKVRQCSKEKKDLIVESHWLYVTNNQGNPESILMVNRDITDKEKMEAKFYRAQRLESIGTLTGGIAHDLNNILTPIMIALNILNLKALDGQSRRIITGLESNVKRGADIIKQLLMFARGAEGEHNVFQPGLLLLETEKMIRETFPKSIEFTSEIESDILSINGDETQLYQVILNLCVNARDAMQHGGKLTLKASNLVLDESYAKMNPEAKIGPYLLISVADTGTGIQPNILEKIFEPFFTTKQLGQGTGLGLSTVMGIVKSHGGFINVYSEMNQGTIFRIYLPAVGKVAKKEENQQVLHLPAGNGELILVAEDEASIRDITRETLEAYGYNVLTADDGVEAISLYVQHKEKIKIVLLDMTMPYMDGPVTIKALQKINPDVKIISMSGLDENIKRAGNSIYSFLQKPYTAEELLNALTDCLAQNEKQHVH